MDCVLRRNSDIGAHGCEFRIALWDFKSGDNIPRCVFETQSCTVGIRGGNGFLGTSGHRQMMNPSVMNLQHRLVLELSVGSRLIKGRHNGGLIYFGGSYKHCQHDLADH